MSLTRSLKQQHLEIKAALEEVKNLGVHTEAGQKKLLQSKALIVAHLKLEDEELYPALKKLEQTKAISKSFQEEMQQITQFVLDFYHKYEGMTQRSIEFSKDFGKLMGELGARIQREEIILYPKYEEHHVKQQAFKQP